MPTGGIRPPPELAKLNSAGTATDDLSVWRAGALRGRGGRWAPRAQVERLVEAAGYSAELTDALTQMQTPNFASDEKGALAMKNRSATIGMSPKEYSQISKCMRLLMRENLQKMYSQKGRDMGMNVNRVIEHIVWDFGLDRVTKNVLRFQEMPSLVAAQLVDASLTSPESLPLLSLFMKEMEREMVMESLPTGRIGNMRALKTLSRAARLVPLI